MSDLKFTSTHEWLRDDGDDLVVGITEHAQQLLGDMVYIELPQIGDEVHAGDELGVVESVKAASDFYAPISGVVTAVNAFAVEEPALVNKDPYAEGWLVKIKPHDRREISELLNEEEYNQEIAEDH